MILSFINIRKVPREMLKTSGFALSFHHLPRDLANVNEWKIMFDPYIINLLHGFLKMNSRAVTKPDVRIRSVQSIKPKSVTSNVTLMPWKRHNQNTCSEHTFFAEIQLPNLRIFQCIFFKIIELSCIKEGFYAIMCMFGVLSMALLACQYCPGFYHW